MERLNNDILTNGGTKLMKNTMEIYFDKEFLFPYNYLDAVDYLLEQYDKSAIYFILESDKLKITNCKIICVIVIEYQNLKTKKYDIIDNVILFPFNLPINYIHLKIVSNGAQLECGIKKGGINFLKEHYPNLQNPEKYSNYLKLSVYDLVMKSKSLIESKQNYTVLYIGKSQKIKNRLYKHETIQKICREYSIYHSETDIFVMLLHPKSKLYDSYEFDDFFSSVTLGNSNWQNNSYLTNKIGNNELLSVTEAMFIQIFNPFYNKKFNQSNPRISQKTYKILTENSVDKITIGLNLYFQECKDIINLSSESIRTESHKLICFSCDLVSLFDKSSTTINIEKIDDEEYSIINS